MTMEMPRSFHHFDELDPWRDRQHMLECTSAVAEAADVMTFTFRSDKPAWFRYLPGQFVTLELPVSAEPVMRTYTLSSSPSRPLSVAVTVKAQPGSIGTRWMFDNLKPGMMLKAFGPLGDFSFVRHPGEKYLFISAGSGVTPMMSMTRWMADCAPETDVTFISCARRPDDLLFRTELEVLARQMPRLNLGFLVEGHEARHGWHGLHGRIEPQELFDRVRCEVRTTPEEIELLRVVEQRGEPVTNEVGRGFESCGEQQDRGPDAFVVVERVVTSRVGEPTEQIVDGLGPLLSDQVTQVFGKPILRVRCTLDGGRVGAWLQRRDEVAHQWGCELPSFDG